MSTLVIRDQVVLLRQARKNAIPHRLIGHERVDEHEPRCAGIPFGHAHMKLDARLDLDVVLLLGRLGQWDANGSLISDVKRHEETRDHVVGRYDGRRLEELLIVLEVGLELVDARLRDVDREGGRIGEAKGRGLERRQRCGRGGEREGSVEVANNGELRSGEASIAADVGVVCRRERMSDREQK